MAEQDDPSSAPEEDNRTSTQRDVIQGQGPAGDQTSGLTKGQIKADDATSAPEQDNRAEASADRASAQE